ncbi:PTS sugar transporter subunit IIB [Lactobacillus sp. ESL0791]|uniref:PTS system mannose/fructose/N-acetylgalactosamine-transporter subunit IIB n=1 Tax=Lactobacillus sp. ESL0791 TaxID=2983234 RepID=UPI0023F8E279|nr:PTS sugar transporter subunit IIB [Lactobacillus sp. ESL0791]MDF7638259.1 PTS sugar transporter subunit IIB [Lactobacillus sp. ESL0791]
MAITLVRVDDRVIHGQTMTRWSKERDVDGFLVVGDAIVNDKLRAKVLKGAAGDYKLGIYHDAEGPQKIEQGKNSKHSFFLISNSPQTFAKLMKNGADFGKELNVGPMNTRSGAIVVGRTLALDQDDYDAFEYMYNNGVKISFQLLPSDEAKLWPEIRDKYNSLKSKE